MTRSLWISDAINELLELAKKKKLVVENVHVGESWEGMHAATLLWVLWVFHFMSRFWSLEGPVYSLHKWCALFIIDISIAWWKRVKCKMLRV